MSVSQSPGSTSNPDFTHIQRSLAQVNAEMTILDAERPPEPADT